MFRSICSSLAWAFSPFILDRYNQAGNAHTAPISSGDVETIRSKPISGLVQEGRYLSGRGVGGEDFGEERGVISPTGFEEQLTGGSALRERAQLIFSKMYKQ